MVGRLFYIQRMLVRFRLGVPMAQSSKVGQPPFERYNAGSNPVCATIYPSRRWYSGACATNAGLGGSIPLGRPILGAVCWDRQGVLSPIKIGSIPIRLTSLRKKQK